MAAFEKAQALVGLSEGGYQNNPKDSGNYYQGVLIGTNWGISAPALATYLGRIPTVAEMKGLSRETARHILETRYWTKHHLGSLNNQSVANLIYDGIVNHGSNSMRMLCSKALAELGNPLEYYHVFSPDGIRLMNRLNQKRLFYTLKKVRADKYRALNNPHFIKGWLNRLDRIRYYDENSLSSIWPVVPILLIGVLLIGFAL